MIRDEQHCVHEQTATFRGRRGIDCRRRVRRAYFRRTEALVPEAWPTTTARLPAAFIRPPSTRANRWSASRTCSTGKTCRWRSRSTAGCRPWSCRSRAFRPGCRRSMRSPAEPRGRAPASSPIAARSPASSTSRWASCAGGSSATAAGTTSGRRLARGRSTTSMPTSSPRIFSISRRACTTSARTTRRFDDCAKVTNGPSQLRPRAPTPPSPGLPSRSCWHRRTGETPGSIAAARTGTSSGTAAR